MLWIAFALFSVGLWSYEQIETWVSFFHKHWDNYPLPMNSHKNWVHWVFMLLWIKTWKCDVGASKGLCSHKSLVHWISNRKQLFIDMHTWKWERVWSPGPRRYGKTCTGIWMQSISDKSIWLLVKIGWVVKSTSSWTSLSFLSLEHSKRQVFACIRIIMRYQSSTDNDSSS